VTEPTTPNIGLISPLTGDLPGAWGTAALNPNSLNIDGLFGGFALLSLSSATTIALSTTTASFTPTAGPSQSSNALLRLSGTLTGTAVIQFRRPGFYIVENLCVVGAFCVTLAPSAGTGNSIGAPPGEKCHVFYDGTSMDYVDLGRVGSAVDLHGVTALPAWMQACTILPYLIKDGTIYSTSIYPALGAQLGSAFGGNGITTFAVPDERSRLRLPIDTGATGRVTAAGSGINGTTMGASGGAQNQTIGTANLPASIPYTDPGHIHTTNSNVAVQGLRPIGGVQAFTPSNQATPVNITIDSATTNITISPGSPNTALRTMVPAIVSFLALIKT